MSDKTTGQGPAAPRQPIVAVLGHVDHGKTTMLDRIRSLGAREDRQASIAERESGGITQHIGATEIPSKLLNDLCAPLIGEKFHSSGLLFIDTPGHAAFNGLRARGGSLADLAVLVIDILDGFKPQTEESIRLLIEAKTPFIVAATKIDRIHGWKCKSNRPFVQSLPKQKDGPRSILDEKIWALIGDLASHGINADLYTRNEDMRNVVSIIPCSARDHEGIQDLLAIIVGLANAFLLDQLGVKNGGGARGTVLEVKDAKGMGRVCDVILSSGELNQGDRIILASESGIIETHVRGMFRPRGMSEMRDAGDRWDDVRSCKAACGVRLLAPNLNEIIPGSLMVSVGSDDDRKEKEAEVLHSSTSTIKTASKGIVIRGDSLGSIEALAAELTNTNAKVVFAGVGQVTRKDIRRAKINEDPLNRAILAYGSIIRQEIRDDAMNEGIEIIEGNIIYQLIDELITWRKERKEALQNDGTTPSIYPAEIFVLKNHIFRRSGPAVVGVRIRSGRIKVGQRLIRMNGEYIGKIRSIRTDETSHDSASAGDELAIAIEGGIVGRNIEEEDHILADLTSAQARMLGGGSVDEGTKLALEVICSIHRKNDHFWGR